jgi:hypothetical protein
MASKRAYIPERIYVRAFERAYLRSLFDSKGFNAAEQTFGAHVYTSLKRQRERREEGGIPVSYSLRRKRLYGSRMPVLTRVFAYKDHSIALHRCREYNFKEPYASEVAAMLSVSTEEYIASPQVEFHSGRTAKKITAGRIFRDANDNPEPDGLQAVWNAMRQPVPINRKNGERHLEVLKVRMEKAAIDFGIGSPQHTAASNRYWNDRFCFLALCDQIVYSQGDISFVVPIYRAASTGRLIWVGGGFQNASKAMKQALISDIPGYNIQNWDFANCHPYIAVQLLEDKLGFEPGHLWSYVENRAKLAQQAGMSEKNFKRANLALINGASMPTSITRNPYTKNSVLDYIIEEAGDDKRKVKQVLQGFAEVTAGLRQEVAAMHDYLRKEWLMSKGERKGRGGVPTVRNDIGKAMPISKFTTGELVSHYLQGCEQKIANALIVETVKAGGRIISHEFDGFTAADVDPRRHLDTAKDVTGIRYAVLKSKSFVTGPSARSE